MENIVMQLDESLPGPAPEDPLLACPEEDAWNIQALQAEHNRPPPRGGDADALRGPHRHLTGLNRLHIHLKVCYILIQGALNKPNRRRAEPDEGIEPAAAAAECCLHEHVAVGPG